MATGLPIPSEAAFGLRLNAFLFVYDIGYPAVSAWYAYPSKVRNSAKMPGGAIEYSKSNQKESNQSKRD
jgi:hypothetical protein